jgi:tetratricopeptide (TPR) repeat protein
LHDIYVDACLLAGEEEMKENNYQEAYRYFRMADQYPENQNYARWEVYPRNAQVYYLTGKALQNSGKKKEAKKYFEMASQSDARFSAYDYFEALALKEIDKKTDVSPLFDSLVKNGKKEVTCQVENFFVSFGPGKTVAEVNAEAYYKIGLGYLGKGEMSAATLYFQKTVETKPDHLWANYFLATVAWQ